MNIIKIKKGDSVPALAATLQYYNGSPIDLNGGSVFFVMGNGDYSPYMSGICTITGSSTGEVSFNWASPSTGSAGRFWGEFRCVWGGSNLTLPNDHSLQIQVSEDYE